MGRHLRPLTAMNPPPPPATEEGQAVESTGSDTTASFSDRARSAMRTGRGNGPVFLADWLDMVFLHFEADPGSLQNVVPFPLDRYEGRTFVSLVAFTMHRFRPAIGGRLTAWLARPMATQRFLNLRTYVRGTHGPGIFFMHEWLDHPLAVRLGPSTFGLPYRRGRLSYQYHTNFVSGRVVAGAEGGFEGRPTGTATTAPAGSREAFLLERYTAYTAAGFRPLAFRVWHEPWRFRRLEPTSSSMETFLKALRQPWTTTLRFAGAQVSDGVRDVWMGRPMRA
jgi:uncharacterized protein YqjF (DUF2071 family)